MLIIVVVVVLVVGVVVYLNMYRGTTAPLPSPAACRLESPTLDRCDLMVVLNQAGFECISGLSPPALNDISVSVRRQESIRAGFARLADENQPVDR